MLDNIFIQFGTKLYRQVVGIPNGTTSRYLDDILNINNVYFDNMEGQIYPSELQLNKANTSDTKAAFLDFQMILFLLKFMINVKTLILKLSISHFLDGDVPRSTSYRVYIS